MLHGKDKSVIIFYGFISVTHELSVSYYSYVTYLYNQIAVAIFVQNILITYIVATSW